MAFPISKQVLLASPVPLSSENLSRYFCAPTGRKYNLSMGLFPFHWGKAVFPWCVQDSRAHPHYSEHLWQLSASILSVHILVPISRADPASRGSPAWILCQGLTVLSSTGPLWQDWVGAHSCLLFCCSLLELRKRAKPMHSHKRRVFPWREAEKSVKKHEWHLENLERSCKGLV